MAASDIPGERGARISLDGAVAVGPGASAGIGAATARALHERGGRVVVAARRVERLEELAAEVGGLAVACDVGDWDDVAEHFLYQYNRYREWGGGETLESAEELPRDRYIVGSSDAVAERFRALTERTRCDRLFFWARPPGLAIELANASLERFAKEVMPRVAAAASA